MKNHFNVAVWKMNDEGFDYCFRYYSDFDEIKDKKFHNLRLAYIKAAEDLEQYVHENADDFFDESDFS